MKTFSFLHNGTYHTDTSEAYLRSLGCTDETISAIQEAETTYQNQWIEQRADAYRKHSDPLFIEWQYDGDEIKEIAWRDEVQRIKDKYPKPTLL